MEYTAPEIALNNFNSTDSDLFSLGILIFIIYAGKPLKLFGSDYSAFRRHANDLNQRKYPPMNAVPSPHLRPKLHDLKEVREKMNLCKRCSNVVWKSVLL